ncbi:leu operon leader peptide [Escherichia coli]
MTHIVRFIGLLLLNSCAA